MEYFQFLPQEITLDILSRVPTQSVMDCKLVCTNWRDLLRHPSFYQMYLHHLIHPSDSAAANSGKMGFLALTERSENPYETQNIQKLYYFEYNDERNHDPIQRITRIHLAPPFPNAIFINSCNGLICLSRPKSFPLGTDSPISICNPITKECVLLPPIKRDSCDTDDDVQWTSGFGYVSSTNEYKVVVLVAETEFVQIFVYTLGSRNGWRNLGNFNLAASEFWSQGIFANGTLYWKNFESELIITLDLAEEKLCERFSPPPLVLPQENSWWLNSMWVLDGFLFFAVSLYVEEVRCYDVWRLKEKKENHDMKEREQPQSLGWTKEFRLFDTGSELLAFTKTDGVLNYTVNYLNIYDTKALTSKRLLKFPECIHEVFPHKNTFVSLKELGEEDAKIMEAVEVEETESHDQPMKQL